MKTITKITVLIVGLLVLGAFVVSLDVADWSLAQRAEPAAQTSDDAPDTAEPEETAADRGTETDIVTEIEEMVFMDGPLVTKTAVEEALATAVGAGILTQEEADGILLDIVEKAAARMVTLQGRPVTDAIEIESEGSGGSPRGGFFAALHFAEAEGLISHDDLRYLMETFADAAGEGVSVTFSDEPGGERIEITMSGSPDEMQQTMQAVVGEAAENGRISPEAAAAIKSYLDEMPAETWGPGATDGRIVMEGGVFEFDEEAREINPVIKDGQTITFAPDVLVMLEMRLAEAVDAGRMTQVEADELLAALTEALAEE